MCSRCKVPKEGYVCSKAAKPRKRSKATAPEQTHLPGAAVGARPRKPRPSTAAAAGAESAMR
eukprot:3174273-Prymnesium_polylepis.1